MLEVLEFFQFTRMRVLLPTTFFTFISAIDPVDKSIKFGENRCAVKFGTGYNSGDSVLIKSCAGLSSPNKHKKGKFQWKFDETTNQIVSLGSKLSSSSSYCWTLTKYVGSTRSFDFRQRVYVEKCDEKKIQQKFKISESGVISVADENWSFLCANVDPENNDILTFSKCVQEIKPESAEIVEQGSNNDKYAEQQESLRLMAIVNANKIANKAKIKAEELVVEANKAIRYTRVLSSLLMLICSYLLICS